MSFDRSPIPCQPTDTSEIKCMVFWGGLLHSTIVTFADYSILCFLLFKHTFLQNPIPMLLPPCTFFDFFLLKVSPPVSELSYCFSYTSLKALIFFPSLCVLFCIYALLPQLEYPLLEGKIDDSFTCDSIMFRMEYSINFCLGS